MTPILTVISKASTYDLTDLATAKSELGLDSLDTSSDAWLTRAITQVSRAIAWYVSRVFAPEYVQDAFNISSGDYRSDYRSDYYRCRGQAELQLSRWPVLGVASVVQTPSTGSTKTLVEGVDFLTQSDVGQLLRLNTAGLVMAWEPVPVVVKYSAGFGALVSESHPVPTTPYQVSVTGATTFSCDQSVSYGNGAALVSVAGAPAQGQYRVAAGVYTFNVADVGQTLKFVYTTRVIPDDLVEVTLRLITGRFKSKDRDPALVQQDTPGVGTQRWWFGRQPGQTGPFPADIEAYLQTYSMPVIA